MTSRKRVLPVVAAVLVLVVGLWVGLMAVSDDPSLAQQAEGEHPGAWTSSAPPPDGVDHDSLSPPDRPESPSDLDEPGAGDPQATWANLRVAGSALKPRESNVEWYGAGGGGCIYAAGGSSAAMFNVPVYLPQGAEVNYLRMHYYDSVSANAAAWFTVYDQDGQVYEEWEVTSTGDGGTGQSVTAEFSHTVNYDLYSYVINWRPNELSSGMQVCGFRLYYVPSVGVAYLPSVQK